MSLFKKKPSGFDEQEKQGAAKSSGSIIVLLILLAGFAYLYFFTSLIVPHEMPTPAKAPEVVTVVKQSMPPKPADQPADPATAEMKKPEEAKPAASPAPPTSPPVPPPPAVKPAAPAPAPSTGKPAVPAAVPKPQASAKPATAPKPQAAAKPAAALSVSTAPKKDAVPAQKADSKPDKAVASKPAPAVKKAVEAKSVKASVPAEKKPVAIKKPESYAIFAGEFPAGDEAVAAEAKLARLGIKPVTRKEIKKSIRMNRLFYGAYTDYDVYAAELEKLRQVIKGAFGVEKNGTYSLYAGSFSARDRVEKEKKNLAVKGVNLQIQPTVISHAMVRLTAGMFSSKKEADRAAAKMKSAGLAAKVVSQRR